MKDYIAERKGVIQFAVWLMLLTLVPYLIGYAAAGAHWRFTGFVIGVEDGNSYIAKMLSGASGKWLFRSPYSIEDQGGLLAFFPYLLLGKLSSSPAQHLQLVALYHAFRFAAGVLAILASYDFISLFVSGRKRRFAALVLAVLGGGVGWILVAFQLKGYQGSLPLEFISPESFGFLGLLGFPHLAAARALLLWGFRSYLTDRNGLRAGLLWLGLGFFQPMFLLVAWAVAGTHSVVVWMLSWRGSRMGQNNGERKASQLISALQAGVISSPIVLYTAYAFLRDPYLKAWSQQNWLPSPPAVHYLIAYGVALPFALIGVIHILRDKRREGLLLVVWMALFPLLINAPLSTQRRLAEGIWVVLVTAMFGYFEERQELPVYFKFITLLLFPSTLMLFFGSVARVFRPGEPLFLPDQQVAAYQFLSQNAEPNAKVVTGFSTGNSLPAWAFVRVIVGHGPETVHLAAWEEKLDRAFAGSASQDACESLFKAQGIDYLLWGPDEKERWNWSPDGQPCLTDIYQAGNYSVYQVIH